MPGVNLIVGNDGSNNLAGAAGNDLIYGFDPNGPQGTVSSITATRVASGLSQTLFATAVPNDPSRLFIVQQTGAIKILDLNTGQVLATPFLNVAVDSSGERGLLGLAFDPDYAHNGFFYIYRTVPGAIAHNEIERYHVSSNPNIADPASATPIISLGDLSAQNHNGGWIGFGPDGYLYAATGENGTPSNAQSANNLLGKIVRIDVHHDAFPGDPANNYAIPADNMFASGPGADESSRWACAIRSATVSIASPATSSSPTSARTPGKRSISARAARTMDGRPSRDRAAIQALSRRSMPTTIASARP
jgi:glucose/arabinose dehydrogenase